MNREDYLSYSRLSGFDRDGFTFFSRKEKDSIALNLGSLVDDILTSGKPINDKYCVIKSEKPTASLLTLFNEIKNDSDHLVVSDNKLLVDVNHINKRVKDLKLWSKMTDVVREEKWNNSKFLNYLKEYILAGDKNIVSAEDFLLAEQIVNGLRNTAETSKYFIDEKGYELLYQVEIFWKYDEQTYRSFIDMIRINHKDKEIEFADLKTTEERFDKLHKSWYMFRYDIQYSMYYHAVRDWAAEHYPDYTLLPMEYVVSSKKNPELPVIYIIDMDWIEAAKFGYKLGRYYKGWVQLTNDINWHYKNQIFDRPKSLVDNGGIFLAFNGDTYV